MFIFSDKNNRFIVEIADVTILMIVQILVFAKPYYEMCILFNLTAYQERFFLMALNVLKTWSFKTA